MSQTYSLACEDCNQHVWIGQGHKGTVNLYYGDKTVMQLLEKFLNEHTDHRLFFADGGNDTRIFEMKELTIKGLQPPLSAFIQHRESEK